MKTKALLLSSLALLLGACGGGGDDFVGAEKPKIDYTTNRTLIEPNSQNLDLSELSGRQYAIVEVYVSQLDRPLETGSDEVYVRITNSGTIKTGSIYCFDEDGDDCFETVTDENGNETEIASPASGRSLNLEGGRSRFAVTSNSNQQGTLGVSIFALGSDGIVSSEKEIIFDVKYNSSGNAYNLSIAGPSQINPNNPTDIAVVITDERGNPVIDPDGNNLIVSATGLQNTILGFEGQVGQSVNAKTESGTAPISVLANRTGLLTITANADASDNNVDNGIQDLISASASILVTNDQLPPNIPIKITTETAPQGAVGVDYEFDIPTSGATPVNFIVTGGTIPPGLNVNADGSITGTPTLEGSYSFTVQVTDVNGNTDTRSISISIVRARLTISPLSFRSASEPSQGCVEYTQAFRIVGQPSTYQPSLPMTWEMDGGGVRTALNANEAEPLKNANGELLPQLEVTVTGETDQVVVNGRLCKNEANANGHAVIFKVTDANGISRELVLPFIIRANNSSGGSSGNLSPDAFSDIAAPTSGCSTITEQEFNLSASNGPFTWRIEDNSGTPPTIPNWPSSIPLVDSTGSAIPNLRIGLESNTRASVRGDICSTAVGTYTIELIIEDSTAIESRESLPLTISN